MAIIKRTTGGTATELSTAKEKKTKGFPASVWVFFAWLVVVAWLAALFVKSEVLPVIFKLRPSATPLEGRLAPTVLHGRALTGCERPTALAFSGDHFFATCGDGRVVQTDVGSAESTLVRYTGSPEGINRYRSEFYCGHSFVEYVCGRPMSCAFDSDGLKLYVLDAYKGLVLWDLQANSTEVLYNTNVTFGNALAVSQKTGRVYFTETSHKRARNRMHEDFLEGGKDGRVLMFDPTSMVTTVVKEGLHSPWGVAVLEDAEAAEEDWDVLAVAEVTRARLLSLTVNEKGKSRVEPLNKALPGIPFGLHYDADSGALWVACMRREAQWGGLSVPNLFVDAFHQWAFPRAILAALRETYLSYLWPSESLVLKLSAQGKVLKAYQVEADLAGGDRLWGSSGVAVHAGKVYVSSFASDVVVEASLQ
jgi:hypothetical protein